MMVLAIALLFGALSALSWYTNHDEYIQVPDVRGMSFDEAKITLEQNGLNPIINDSVFIEKALPLSIVSQNPESESDVKDGRTIYLTINTGKIPTVSAPKFVDMSITLAQAVMKNKGLKLGKITTAYDELRSFPGIWILINTILFNKEANDVFNHRSNILCRLVQLPRVL